MKTNRNNTASPAAVHNRIIWTLNRLPDRKSGSRKGLKIAVVACLALIFVALSAVWTINPVFAQGITFRESVSKFLGFNDEAQGMVEAPLQAEEVQPEPKGGVPEGTAALTEEDEQGVQVPAVQLETYVFELEPQTVYDGSVLVCGFNVRKADGSDMPDEATFTKDHLAGFIRIREMLIDDEVVAFNKTEFDRSDPAVYRQVCSFDLGSLNTPITEDTTCVLRVAYYHYGPDGIDQNTTYAELPFSVNLEHQDYAAVKAVSENTLEFDDFTIEILPIVENVMGSEVTIKAYKEGDAEFGTAMDGQLMIGIKDIDGKIIPCPPNSEIGHMGAQTDESGNSYMEYTYYIDPGYTIPSRIMLVIRQGEAEAETVLINIE